MCTLLAGRVSPAGRFVQKTESQGMRKEKEKKNENQPSAFLEKSRGSVQELLASLGCLLMSTMDETQTKLDAILILPAAREQAPVLGRVRVRLCGEDALVSTA